MPLRFARFLVETSGLLLLGAMLVQPLFAASSSDLLVILDADGKQFLAQQTLTTDDELLLLELPADRVSLQVQFSGPEIHCAPAQSRHLVALVRGSHYTLSGEVITRYRHAYAENITVLEDDSLELNITLAHPAVDADDNTNLTSTLTWILPEGASVLLPMS